MTKKEIRREMKQRNLALAADERSAASERIFRKVGRLAAFDAAKCVAVFCSLADEPDTKRALERWSWHKRIVVPRVGGGGMSFCDYNPSAMIPGAFGIPEPGPDAKLCSPDEIDLIVVPGTAFTAAGQRMGRGGGYYDKYLSQRDCLAVKVGVCYAHQIVEALPLETHDVAVDCVCSD